MSENEKETPEMFDERLSRLFRETAHRAFLNVPELRSVVVTYDYYRELNDAPNVSKGIWLTAETNQPKPIDSVIGSLGALIQNTAQVLEELFQRKNQMDQLLVTLSKKIMEKQRELENLQ